MFEKMETIINDFYANAESLIKKCENAEMPKVKKSPDNELIDILKFLSKFNDDINNDEIRYYTEKDITETREMFADIWEYLAYNSWAYEFIYDDTEKLQNAFIEFIKR